MWCVLSNKTFQLTVLHCLHWFYWPTSHCQSQFASPNIISSPSWLKPMSHSLNSHLQDLVSNGTWTAASQSQGHQTHRRVLATVTSLDATKDPTGQYSDRRWRWEQQKPAVPVSSVCGDVLTSKSPILKTFWTVSIKRLNWILNRIWKSDWNQIGLAV